MRALALAFALVALSAVGMGTPGAGAATIAADRALLSSAAAGSTSGVRDALRAGASVAATDSAGSTALILAAYGNHLAVARQLIGAGSDVNQQNRRRESAFLIATSEVGDDPRLLGLTLAAGARVQARDSFDGTGLIRAAERGFPVIVARLIEAGVEVDHVNNLGWTALHEAIVLGSGGNAHTEVVRLLVGAGADVMLPSQRDGVRPLEHAERLGHDRIARILRRAAVGLTPTDRLLAAASRGSVVAARTALQDGAALEARDDEGRTALLLAALEDRVDVARMLVTRGADVNAYDERRDTPFLVTGVTGSVSMLEALLPGGPDTRLTNRFGGVAVIPASERGHVAYVREVLERTDMDVNHVNDLGWTALLEAVLLGDGSARYARVVKVLLGHGADPAISDADGVTPLAHAERRGHERIARLLR
ncbi:MAG: ankyrin repeat domain-containing protein [Actinomycetota bacterium]|nr:ankyrin repeat domain-containing protein [Actinomycetota bacterium]